MLGTKIEEGTLIRIGGTRTDERGQPQSQPDLAGKDLTGNNFDWAGNQAGNIWREAQYPAKILYPPDLVGRLGSAQKTSGGKFISGRRIISDRSGRTTMVDVQTAYWSHNTCTVYSKYIASMT